jgi:hypothetical protein
LPEITLVISPTTLDNDTALTVACNLKINESGELNKNDTWDNSTNTTFTNYLTSLHITTIRFESVSSINNEAFYDCTALTNISLPSSLTSIGE